MSMNKTPEEKSVDQWAHEAVREFIARQVLVLSNDLRREADRLCAAHLRYERPSRGQRA
jgi:hypothetical protein